MAALELLARAARARVVAADLGADLDRLAGRPPRGRRWARRTVGRLFALIGSALERVARWRGRRLLLHLQVEDGVDHLRPDGVLQLVEHARRLDLLFNEWAALTVGAQADAL